MSIASIFVPKALPGPLERRIVPPDMDHQYFAHAADFPFRPHASGFDPVNALWCAEFALLAYCHPQFIRLAAHVAGLKRYRFFDGSVAECFVVGTPDFSIVFTRGTEVFSLNAFFDVIADLNVRQVEETAGGRVHRGFRDSLDEVWAGSDGLERHLSSLKKEYGPDHRLWFAGHSLGAAIVTLAAARCEDVGGLYTFGSPRVGNIEFAETFAAPAFRIVNSRDPVAFLPPSFKLPGNLEVLWKHVGGVYRFDSSGELTHPERETENRETAGSVDEGDDSLQRRIRRWIKESVPGPPTDHAPLYYVLRAWNYLCGIVAEKDSGTVE